MQLPPIRSGRPELQGEGFCLGVTSSKKTGGVVFHSHVSDFPEVVAEIIHVLYVLECIPGDFPFSSIQVNHNPAVHPHRDKNGGKSLALSFGSFEGGVLVIDGAAVDSYQNAILFDGAKEHYVTPHSGNRWSMVIFMHAKARALNQFDQQFLKKIGFNLTPNAVVVSDVERGCFPSVEQMPAGDLHDKGTSVDERNAFSVIEWASGVFPASFILDSLKVKHRAVICTSDAELIMGIQKTKLNVSFGGYTAGNQMMLAANLEDFVNSGRPLLVANLTGVALKRQRDQFGDEQMSFNDAVKAVGTLIDVLDALEGSQVKAVIVTDPFDDEGMNKAELAFHCLSFEFWLSDFTSCSGTYWTWIRGDLSWPKGASQPKHDGVPRIRPPRHFKWKAEAVDVIQKPWFKLESASLFRPLEACQALEKAATLSGPDRHEKCDSDLWRLEDDCRQRTDLYNSDNMVSSLSSGTRRLCVAEEERLIGLPDGASDCIERVPHEPRAHRQARRHNVVAYVCWLLYWRR